MKIAITAKEVTEIKVSQSEKKNYLPTCLFKKKNTFRCKNWTDKMARGVNVLASKTGSKIDPRTQKVERKDKLQAAH